MRRRKGWNVDRRAPCSQKHRRHLSGAGGQRRRKELLSEQFDPFLTLPETGFPVENTIVLRIPVQDPLNQFSYEDNFTPCRPPFRRRCPAGLQLRLLPMLRWPRRLNHRQGDEKILTPGFPVPIRGRPDGFRQPPASSPGAFSLSPRSGAATGPQLCPAGRSPPPGCTRPAGDSVPLNPRRGSPRWRNRPASAEG